MQSWSACPGRRAVGPVWSPAPNVRHNRASTSSGPPSPGLMNRVKGTSRLLAARSERWRDQGGNRCLIKMPAAVPAKISRRCQNCSFAISTTANGVSRLVGSYPQISGPFSGPCWPPASNLHAGIVRRLFGIHFSALCGAVYAEWLELVAVSDKSRKRRLFYGELEEARNRGRPVLENCGRTFGFSPASTPARGRSKCDYLSLEWPTEPSHPAPLDWLFSWAEELCVCLQEDRPTGSTAVGSFLETARCIRATPPHGFEAHRDPGVPDSPEAHDSVTIAVPRLDRGEADRP